MNLIPSSQQELFSREDIDSLLQLDRSAFIEEGVYTSLFIALQKYNQIDFVDPILPLSCPELQPVKIGYHSLVSSLMEGIPESQQFYITYNGKTPIYRYNEADTHIYHRLEGLRIFFNTQNERLESFIGKAFSRVMSLFNLKSSLYKNSHYFRNNENLKEIYASDQPLDTSDKPTFYFLGHASGIFSVPVPPLSIKITLITDPVEGAINRFLYPRMVPAAKVIEDCPVPHIFLLSHNHLDHYEKATIEKLKIYQPLMLVPEGDGDKFRKMGFNKIHEFSWWEQLRVPIEHHNEVAELTITAVPANHWSGQNPFNMYHSLFLGYILHQEAGDIYYAGDTARLSEAHIETLRSKFNIKTLFQPGGPDERRSDMKSTHQASVDGLWMHFNLLVRGLYERGNFSTRNKQEFLDETKDLKTLFVHMKAYKLGNVHFDDTDVAVDHVKDLLRNKKIDCKDYEHEVYEEILRIGGALKFRDHDFLTPSDILFILESGIVIPKLGSRTALN